MWCHVVGKWDKNETFERGPNLVMGQMRRGLPDSNEWYAYAWHKESKGQIEKPNRTSFPEPTC